MKNFPSHYLNPDMTPFDIIGEQMDFLYEQGKKIAKDTIDYQDEENELQVQRSLEEDMEHDCHLSPEDGCKGCSSDLEAKGEMAYDAYKETHD